MCIYFNIWEQSTKSVRTHVIGYNFKEKTIPSKAFWFGDQRSISHLFKALRKILFFPDLRIRRQHSSESMSSINSAASHSSMGSLGKDAEDKKKKKKSWVGGET